VFDLVDTIYEEVITFMIKTTFTNLQTHYSTAVTITVVCDSTYTISPDAAATSPQYVTHNDATVGFLLPTYTSSQQDGCPVNSWEISTVNTGITPPWGLNDPVDDGTGIMIIRPIDITAHYKYDFHVKVTAYGGSTAWFGPFSLDVGCTTTSVTFTDNPAFVTDVPVYVGDSPLDVYTLAEPTSSRVYCTIKQHEIVNTDGTAWSGSPQMGSTVGCLSQPCTVFDLIQTTNPPEVITFKILTTWDSRTHLSPAATITITCSPNYVLSEVSAPTNPQIYQHLDAAVGFQPSSYTHP